MLASFRFELKEKKNYKFQVDILASSYRHNILLNCKLVDDESFFFGLLLLFNFIIIADAAIFISLRVYLFDVTADDDDNPNRLYVEEISCLKMLLVAFEEDLITLTRF